MKNKEIHMFTRPKNIDERLSKIQNKKEILMFEYQILLLYTAQYGIYLVPQLENFQIWHGTIFIRNGLYKQGKFKFKCNFNQFPNRPPEIVFVSKVFHPLVNYETGQFDLMKLLESKTNYLTDYLLHEVFEKIKSLFSDVKKLEFSDSFNPTAYQLFKFNIEQFYIKVRDCVQLSKQNIYENYQNTSMRFTQSNEQHRKIIQQLTNVCGKNNLSFQHKKKQFLKYLLQ